jgi:hypothetical protein
LGLHHASQVGGMIIRVSQVKIGDRVRIKASKDDEGTVIDLPEDKHEMVVVYIGKYSAAGRFTATT